LFLAGKLLGGLVSQYRGHTQGVTTCNVVEILVVLRLQAPQFLRLLRSLDVIAVTGEHQDKIGLQFESSRVLLGQRTK
jgi:hypothetical protein